MLALLVDSEPQYRGGGEGENAIVRIWQIHLYLY